MGEEKTRKENHECDYCQKLFRQSSLSSLHVKMSMKEEKITNVTIAKENFHNYVPYIITEKEFMMDKKITNVLFVKIIFLLKMI